MLYEIRRAIARKRVITLIALTLFFEIGVYVLLEYAKTTRFAKALIPLHPYMWMIGVLLPESLLIHFIAISISAGSMSEEYEQGTMDFLLTKPITRLKFVMGKFVGGYLLLIGIYAIMIILSLFFSFVFFGNQIYLNFLSEISIAVIFSALTFYSIAFLIGELVRRGNIAFLISSVILITSVILISVLTFLSFLTKSSQYLTISMYFPTWGSEALPFMIAQNVPGAYFLVEALMIFPIGEVGNLTDSILSILFYSSIAIFVAIYTFLHRDIPKRVF